MSKIAEKQINEQTVKELIPVGAQNTRLAYETIDGVNVPLATFASVAGTSAFYYIMMNGGSFDLAVKVSNKLSKNIPIMVHNAIQNTQDIKNKSKQKAMAMEMVYDFISRFLLSNLQDLEPGKCEVVVMAVLALLRTFSATDVNESRGSGEMGDSKYDQYLSVFNNNSWLADQVKSNLNGGYSFSEFINDIGRGIGMAFGWTEDAGQGTKDTFNKAFNNARAEQHAYDRQQNVFGNYANRTANATYANRWGANIVDKSPGILSVIGGILKGPVGAVIALGTGHLASGIYSAVAQSKYQDAMDKINEIKAKQWQYGDNNLTAQERDDLKKAEGNKKFWEKWGPNGMVGSRLMDLTHTTSDVLAGVAKDYSLYVQKKKIFENAAAEHAAEEKWKYDQAKHERDVAMKAYRKDQIASLIRLGSLALSFFGPYGVAAGMAGNVGAQFINDNAERERQQAKQWKSASKFASSLAQEIGRIPIGPRSNIEDYYHPRLFSVLNPTFQPDYTLDALERSARTYEEHEKKRLAETFKKEPESNSDNSLAMLSKLAALKDEPEKVVVQAQAGQRGKAKALSTKIVPTLPNMRIFKTPVQGLSRMKTQPYKRSTKVNVKTGKQKLGKRK